VGFRFKGPGFRGAEHLRREQRDVGLALSVLGADSIWHRGWESLGVRVEKRTSCGREVMFAGIELQGFRIYGSRCVGFRF